MDALLSGLSRGIGIGCAIYVFMDAKKRGRNRWVWAILTVLFGFLVLGIYLLVTGRKVWGIIWVVLGVLELALVILGAVVAGLGLTP
jgi:hypothetical protein